MRNGLGCAAGVVVVLLCLAGVVLSAWSLLRQAASFVATEVPAAAHGSPTAILFVVAALIVVLVLALIVKIG